MTIANWFKFRQNPELRKMLFQTGQSLLVEATSRIYTGVAEWTFILRGLLRRIDGPGRMFLASF
uniref:Uncharacterized protein n=1 Tax=Meloidogyne enterolobii TaxID=390850 RepID=A0A6V7WN34_MELEN|nr:unnamed protein product [Meloidogyne enterolobii]